VLQNLWRNFNLRFNKECKSFNNSRVFNGEGGEFQWFSIVFNSEKKEFQLNSERTTIHGRQKDPKLDVQECCD